MTTSAAGNPSLKRSFAIPGQRSRTAVRGTTYPGPDDYFVLKPKHSGFYQTPLELLLKHLGAVRLIIAGVSTNSCVLFTANDAYMRDMELVVPRDCVAACNAQEHCFAMDQIKNMLSADTRLSTELELE